MRVVISVFAQQQIRKTAKYILEKFGKKSKDTFIQKVKETRKLLETNPYLGPEEPLLANMTNTYHSVVISHLNKMIYRILDNRIEISDLWDCRREPNKQAKETLTRNPEEFSAVKPNN